MPRRKGTNTIPAPIPVPIDPEEQPAPDIGRPPRLDDPALVRNTPDGQVIVTVSARILELTRLGISHTRAALIAGVAEKTFYNWRTAGLAARARQNNIDLGTDTRPLTVKEARYLRFLQGLEESIAQAELDRLLTIQNAQLGGARSTKVTRKIEIVWLPDPAAPDDPTRATRVEREIERSEVVTTEPPQWTAAAWWLERRIQDRYAKRIEIAGAEDNPLRVEISPAARLREQLDVIRERSAGLAALAAVGTLPQPATAEPAPDPGPLEDLVPTVTVADEPVADLAGLADPDDDPAVP